MIDSPLKNIRIKEIRLFAVSFLNQSIVFKELLKRFSESLCTKNLSNR